MSPRPLPAPRHHPCAARRSAHRGHARAVVRLETSRGVIDVEVIRAWAPHSADRFVALARHGCHDAARFFRVTAGRWVQFGGIRAGKQDACFERGHAWLLEQCPRLDYIRRATVRPGR